MMKKIGGGGFAKTLACVVLCGLAMLPSAASAISGTWVQDRDTNPQMRYMISGTTVDVQGRHNNSWLKTTYSDQGYQVIKSENLGNATITAKPSFINEGRFVQLKYIVEATKGDVKGGRFAVYTDVQIGSSDKAPMECIRNRKGQVIGLKMSEEGANPAQFNLYFSQSGGVTNVNTYWYGKYSDARDTYYYTQIGDNVNSITGIDTGFAVSWQNINLKQGERKEFSILVGVGEAADPPEFGSSSIPPIKLNMALNATKDNLKINVEASVKDKPGVTDTLYYEEGGNRGTLGSVTANGSFQTINGQLDLTGKPDGTYTYKFWLGSSQGVMSETVTCTVTIQNGAVIGDENFTKPAEGDHNWSDKWSYDDNNHWHICTNGNCTITDVTQNKDYEKHERDDGVVTNGNIVFSCKKCGHTIESRPAVRHDIAYETNGGTMPEDTRDFYYEGQTFPLPIPNKQCYTFEGWYENPDFSGAPVEQILSSDKGNRKFYAKWKENEKYSIEFDVDGGTMPEDTRDFYYEGQEVPLPIPSKPYHTFKGWYENPDFSGAPVDQILSSDKSDREFYAKWEENEKYNIEFDVDGGTMPEDTRNFYHEGQEFPLPIPNKQCHTFEGWYENPDFSGAPVDQILSSDTGNRKFYAKWKENEKHNIKFDVDGGKIPEDTKGTFTEGENTKLPIPKKDGFIFEGWYTDPDFKGDPVTKIDPNATGDLKFYAKWKVDPSAIANLPKTGDSANPLMWVVMLAAAGACAIGLKKKHT